MHMAHEIHVNIKKKGLTNVTPNSFYSWTIEWYRCLKWTRFGVSMRSKLYHIIV